ncbi:MAG: DNA-processing protein DprA [Litorilinea sp.]
MNPKAYWIGFNKARGIGAVRLNQLLATCGSIEAAWRAPIHQLQQAGLDRRSLESLLAARQSLDLAAEWERVQRAGIQVITWEDADYPENLRHIDNPPPVLYVRGTLLAADIWAVGIVGTRRASTYGREVAYQLARQLAQAGVTVVSGLALGVDTVAHKAALEAGGRSLTVLGSGVDQIYPPENRGLARALADQGAVISEYALGTRPDARNFPPRNRIISGLSKGVIIVEAGVRSGALITARFAADQGRDVFAVPGSILHPGSAGCNALIQDGAVPVVSVQDVLAQLNLERVHQHKEVQTIAPGDAGEAAILSLLNGEPQHMDDIIRRARLPQTQVAGLLTLMELKGIVRQVGVQHYVRK